MRSRRCRTLLLVAVFVFAILFSGADAKKKKKPAKPKIPKPPATKVAMAFVTFISKGGVKPNNQEEKHPEANQRALEWRDLLATVGIETKSYSIEDDKVLFIIEDGSKVWDVMDFMFQRDEVTLIEYESQKFYNPNKPKPPETSPTPTGTKKPVKKSGSLKKKKKYKSKSGASKSSVSDAS